MHKECVSAGVLQSVPRGCGLLSNEGFVVRHYAADLVYRAAGLVAKHADAVEPQP